MNSMLVSRNPHPSQMVWNRQSSSTGRVQCPLPRRRWCFGQRAGFCAVAPMVQSRFPESLLALGAS